MERYDALVIGAGPAGLAAAISLRNMGIKNILLVDREPQPGGILMQCIHNGFGLRKYKDELTGPEYAEREIDLARKQNIGILSSTTVLRISPGKKFHSAILLSVEKGLLQIETKAIIMAMGCRERNRGNISIPGSRPAGIMTAGLAQKLVNCEGFLPGKNIVILGSGDIGLIMARRLTWEGARVSAVIEIKPYPGGLARNIVQCLNDFGIPLYLSHRITNIRGNKRIEGVDVAGINGAPPFSLKCDTLLLSIGLIPENELSINAGVVLHPFTKGAVVDQNMMTNIPGIFACGNVLHVHDIVDYVSEEAEYCGRCTADFINDRNKLTGTITTRAGNLVSYVLPSKTTAQNKTVFSLRTMAPSRNSLLTVKTAKKGMKEIIFSRKYRVMNPGEMIRITLPSIPEKTESLLFSIEMGGE